MEQAVTRRRAGLRTAAALAVGALGLVATAGPAFAGGGGGHGDGDYEEAPEPDTHHDVPEHGSCDDYVPECPNEFTIGLEALFEVGDILNDEESGLEVTITAVGLDAEGNVTFDLTTNYPVSSVFVRSGDEGQLFELEAATTAVEGLVSLGASISEISFCFEKPDTPPGTPPPSTTPSTTPDSSTTSSTTPDSSTTTAPEETTTTAPSSTVTTEPSTTTTTGEELPRTGSNSTMIMVMVGAALLAVGAALVLGTRRVWHNRA
jgi:LPXTG-motif cell wall-anchored protein